MGNSYPKVSGLCPLFCQKCRTIYSALEKNRLDRNKLLPQAENYTSICRSLHDTGLLLGIESLQTRDAAIFLLPESSLHRRVQLFMMPISENPVPVVTMDIKYRCQRTVEIIDWASSIENRGYGSILMKKLLAYLKLAGYSKVVGEICPADFGHEGKLRHFYTKFGFTITDRKTYRLIELIL